jgi:hypothetical protein
MTQAIGCGTLTMEARVQFQASTCGTCGGQSGTGTDLSLSTLISLVIIMQPMLHTHSLILHRHHTILAVSGTLK